MAIVYILFSVTLDKYYIGATTLLIEERLVNHNDKYYDNKYTSKGIPWNVYWYREVENMQLAMKIEQHIKNMKSRTYIENLAKYSDIINK